MRLFVWILGVMVTLHALMVARALVPAWAWVWWVFLGLWVWVGLIVFVMALVRVGTAGMAGRASRTPAPPKGED